MERLIAKMGINFNNGPTPYRGAVPNPAKRRRHAFSAVAFLAAVVFGLLFLLLPGGLLQAQDDGTIMYPENGTVPVATYTAVDPEMTAIASWSLGGTDAALFSIEGGVLTFKKSPDFEMAGTDNMYSVTVQAKDSTGKTGMKTVTVEVTNVEEPGMVSLSALQPQAGTELTAMDSDPDGNRSDLKWQWAKSMTMDGTYEDIDKAISSAYTPKDADIDYYLRVTASYTDPEGEGKTAMATSAYAVQGVRSENKPPAFLDQDPDTPGDQNETATRKVAENTPAGSAIGDPVVAEDENGDILTYTLDETSAMSFDIDWATGQLMTKAMLDLEVESSYGVTVRATDPAGDPDVTDAVNTNSAEITVTITITDVNEPPDIARAGDAPVTFAEVTDNIASPLDTYTEDNPEDNLGSTWSVAGADGSKFDISTNGELKFKAKPDYEMPTDANMDNVYEVTVRAADADGNTGTMDVKVTVTNEDEDGTVTLSKTQPRVGVAVTASVADPDGSISGLTWQWYNDTIVDANAIEGANSDTYIPKEIDADPNSDGNDTDGVTLLARANYTDGHEAEADKFAVGMAANKVAFDTRNKAPVFADQDTETDGVQNTETTRKVEENAEAADDADPDVATDNVGRPVTANDPDPNADPLTYTLGGTDASKFRVRQDDTTTTDKDEGGQIEVGADTKLDYETKTTYMLTVMAEDSFGDSASIMVTITVTDVNEGPDITGDDTIEHPENRTRSVETYRASDPERAGTITWSLAGTDAALFDISSIGVLTFKKSPDYEMPGDVAGTSPSTAAANDNMYEVSVQATDADRRMGTKPVTVEVTNVDEPGVVTLSARQPMAGVPLTATITDPDSVTTNNMTGSITTGVDWQWQKGSSNIPNADGETYTPEDSDRGSYLRATATYKDPESRMDTKRANVRSDYVVLRAASGNNAPEFADDQDPVMEGDQADAARKVAENTEAGENIGAPVRATDADSDQRLTYTLGGTDDASFDIDWATGQIMTKAALDFETAPTIQAGKGFTVTVMATDPADTDNSVTVKIMVTDVNEPPTVTGTGEADPTFNKDTDEIAAALDTYSATDPEEAEITAWSVAGADGSKFNIGNETGGTPGQLKFKAKPDYEMPTDANMDNVYEVTVRAADADGYIGTKAVKVTVTNVDEDGVVTLSKTRPRVGIAVTASVTDPDGSIFGLTWQWSISDATGGAGITATPNGPIAGATSDTYTPKAGDIDGSLTATASYFDGESAPDSEKKAAMDAADNAVAADTRNRAPVFEDQDTETDGVQNTETTRKVEENAEAADDDDPDSADDNVGGAVTANDPDPNTDELTYTLGGPDKDSFTVRDNGQIEVGAGTKLDYETKTTYMVTLMAEDSFGASATIMVTIMVTDVDEAPEIMMVPDANVAPEFASATTSRTVAENTAAVEDIGTPVAATDNNGDALTYALSGTDAASFDIDPDTGQLMTLAALDYEAKATYSVTVAASDSGGLSDSIDVTITVTNVEEPGMVTLWASATEALTMAPQVGDKITGAVMDPDGGVTGESWQWSRTTTPAMMDSWMDIAGETNAAYTVTAGDTGYYLRVMATYTDKAGTAMVYSMPTLMVTMMTFPMFESETATRVVAENMAAGMNIGHPVTATDDDNDILTYTLEDADGGTDGDSTSFDIGSATGQLMTKEALDYETKSSYEVTVTATDPDSASDMITVSITVTNVEEMGEVTLSATEPVVGAELTATLADADVVVAESLTWQWSRSDVMAGTFTDISGATMDSYTPREAVVDDPATTDVDETSGGDVGMYLRAAAMYNDGHGNGKSAAMESANAVNAVDEPQPADFDPLAEYDADKSGALDKDEVIQAINDYLFGVGADAISKEDVIETINLYLFG